MNSALIAIGTANPIYKQTQSQAAEMVAKALNLKPAEARLLKSVYRSTGIEYRHSVISDFCKQMGEYEFFPNDAALPFPSTAARMRVYKENALGLAINAVNQCFNLVTDFDKSKITHVITISCTGMYAPGIDIELIEHFKLNTNAKRFAINFMGCYGAFNGLKLADAICRADTDAVVLMVSVELCTLHFQKNESMDHIISNAIFADGAAAVLIEANTKDKKHLKLHSFHCDLMPQTSKEMAWQISDNGFDIVLSSYVPQAIQSGIAPFLQNLLKNDNQPAIDLYAIHPGGQKILKACEEALSITPDDNRYSYEVLKQYGNMSSATVLFVLKAIWDDVNKLDEEKTILSCAFGPGLTLESMLLKVGY